MVADSFQDSQSFSKNYIRLWLANAFLDAMDMFLARLPMHLVKFTLHTADLPGFISIAV
jgi:hypothetical protein